MPGPLPKPADRRQRPHRGNARQRQLALPPRRRLAEVPEPLKGWLPLTIERWSDYWQSDVARMVEAQTDGAALMRLFTLYDERERAYRAYRRKRMVPGSQGQPVVNPIWKHAAVMDSEIRQLEDRFGITPQARLRLGVQLGEAVRSLEDMNQALRDGDEPDQQADPRIALVRPA
jgi:phage terminase small subunit